MNTYALTDVGRARETNEDAVLATDFNGQQLLVVADGMGGHAAGDVASKETTTELRRIVGEQIDGNRIDPEAILKDAIEVANQQLHRMAEEDPSLSGMGTTVVAALIDDGKATIANVGDSRAYHVDETIEQITVDQSLVQELVNSGEITEEEARTHPQRNVVSQALGTTESVDPDFYQVSISGTLLLCSDGLTEEVNDTQIKETVTSPLSLEEAAERLVEQANTNGGSDNISVILGEYRGTV